MARKDLGVLPKKAKVIAYNDLVGVPEGTEGKVVIVNGISWIRYWVRWANGKTVGSVNRVDLATPDEWANKLAGGDEPTVEATSTASGSEAGAAETDGGEDAVINGVTVPAMLIARSAAARARLAA